MTRTSMNPGRDLDKPLVAVDPSDPPVVRAASRLLGSYVWLILGIGVLALILWTLALVLGAVL